jgi:hypothetical protein
MAMTAQGRDLSVVLNAIRATSSSAYQTAIPMATAANIMDVGKSVLNAPTAIRNEFMSNLYNKVGLTLIDSPVIENEFAFLKKGTLEYGQMIEDIYVGLAQSEPYITGMNGNGSEYPDPFTIKKLPHYSAFYSTILSRQYQVTRHLTDLRKAFHTGGGVEQFVAGMMNALVSAENFDDMRATIALIARQIEAAQTATEFKGNVHLITDYNALYNKSLTADDAFTDQGFIKYFANQLKKYSKRLRHLRTDLNVAGVQQTLPQTKQRIMMLEDITVDFDTELLAWAYHADKFKLGGIDEIDAWYSIGADHSQAPVVSPEDIERKAKFTTAGGGSSMCAAVIYDEDMVKIYNKERVASDQANNKGNYWNMFMSLEDIYACSPYKNFVCFMLD